MPATLRNLEDKISTMKFSVEIDGVAACGFSEVSGLEMETDVIEYREGCDSTTPRKFRGLTKFSDITLKRGISSDLDIWNLGRRTFDAYTAATGFSSPIYRFDLYIVQRDMANIDQRVWKVTKAWVKKFMVSDMNANQSEVAIEEVVLASEGFWLEN